MSFLPDLNSEAACIRHVQVQTVQRSFSPYRAESGIFSADQWHAEVDICGEGSAAPTFAQSIKSQRQWIVLSSRGKGTLQHAEGNDSEGTGKKLK